MAGFKASEQVSALTYDFRGFEVADSEAQGLLDQAHGVTPEPSTRQFRRFQARQREILGLPVDTTQDEVNKVLAGKSEEEWAEMDEEVLDTIAEVTSGRPSREELAALPMRIQQKYFGWVIGELTNPTTGSGTSTRRSLAPVKHA